MIKPVIIIAGEPNSISSEIIFKSWKNRKKFNNKPILVIGSFKLLNSQNKKLNFNINLKKVDRKLINKNIYKNSLLVYDVDYNQKKPFEKITIKSNEYIFRCFEIALNLIKNKKIIGFINCPIAKETLFKKKDQGVTEYLAKKANIKNQEVMLIYNKNLSVSPITTHIQIKKVAKKITKRKILNKILTINNFYKKVLKKKPFIGVLGLNPHSFSSSKKSEEKVTIIPAIKEAKKRKISVFGPISPDSAFVSYKDSKINVLVGMYHDQVLSPFKSLFKYNAINITLGLPYIRISPDHGVGQNIMGKKIANPQSLIESIKFFNQIK